ncbi:PorV/PorQ family protein [candidate division KSB1 bacterium]|nr:PorV/PorQ family protein [candidate division KSB1 bacterium]
MKKFNILLCLIIVGTLLLTTGQAQIKKVGQTGLQFLKIDVGARASAMGGSYMMIGEDASAMFYNPAGMARMGSMVDLFVTRTQWFAGINYDAGAIAYNAEKWGVFGISFINSSYGDDIIGTRYSADSPTGFIETGNLNLSALAVGISYARAMTNKFTIGGQIKFAYQNLGENLLSSGKTDKNEVSGLAYDFGTMFYPGFKSFRLGMAIRNFSPEFKYVTEGFELPLTFTLGFAMDILDLFGEHENPLTISLDAVHPRDYTERINLGLEYNFMNMIALRGGYKFNYDVESLTGGIGFKKDFGAFAVDFGYAYSSCEYFDSVNRLAFGVSF